jgi:MoxR-like ATPase
VLNNIFTSYYRIGSYFKLNLTPQKTYITDLHKTFVSNDDEVRTDIEKNIPFVHSIQKTKRSKAELFDNIVGHHDVKKLFTMSFLSEKPVHILLVGPPASAKTLFMLECMKLERSYFTLGSHSTRSGMLDYLFEKRPRYLLVDEIEHMPIKDQTALLSLMETGIIAETKFQRTRSTQLKTWIYATSNSTDRLLSPLLSRFLVLHFRQYKYENFHEVAVHLLCNQGTTREMAASIAEAVWSKMKSKDMRDCIKIGHLAKTKDDINWIVETLKNYK